MAQKPKPYFDYEVTAYLGDTNIFGTVYFSKYFEWQGKCREEYYLLVKDYGKLLASGTILITKKAWVDYEHECRTFDKIILRLQNRNIKRCSFEMIFTYINKKTGQVIARGGQILTFADKQGKITRIPEGILDLIKHHIIED